MFLICSLHVPITFYNITIGDSMKNKIPYLSLEKSLIADIINLFIIGMSLVLYGLVTFCF